MPTAVKITDVYNATKRNDETLAEWRAEWQRLSDEEKEWYRSAVVAEQPAVGAVRMEEV